MMLLQILCVVICKANWKLIYDRFDEPQISSSDIGWDFKESCNSVSACQGSIFHCTENKNTMLELNHNCQSMNKDFNGLTPHFQLKFIYDLYILGSRSGGSFTILVYADQTQIYTFTYDSTIAIYSNKLLCDHSGDDNFLYKTRVETFQHDTSSVNLKFCTTVKYDDLFVGIRNIQLYQNSCNAKCKKCSSYSDCTECYYGTPNAGICPDCPQNTLFIDITKSSCQQECDSDKVADSGNICQPDLKISEYNKYFDSEVFSSYGDWKLIADPFQYSLSGDRVIYSLEQLYVGPFGANDAMFLELNLENTVQYIRLRVTFDFYYWTDGTSISILWNNVPIDLIYQKEGILYSQSSTIILNILYTDIFQKKVRIEKLFTNTEINSKLTFKGNMQVDLMQRWAFRDIYIDYGVCEKNCDLCASSTKCQTCSGSRKKHKGKCLSSCPLYSTQSGQVCNDFDDDLDYSKYYIKAFYDTSTTDEEASTIMGKFESIGSNNLISGGVMFSYLPYKRVFGGSFVWFNARVYRNITNIQPHYQYKLKMEIVLGEREGNFYYNFSGGSDNSIIETGGGAGNLPSPTNQSNIWGLSGLEYQYSIDQIITHSLDYLNFEMRYDCQQANPQDGFAAISNFYLIFYYCVPLCPSCTGPTNSDCTWGSTYDSVTMQQLMSGGPITCKDHYYLLAYESTVTYSCKPCGTNCDVCTSATYCMTCFTDFYSVNGLCECKPGTYLSTLTTCSVCHEDCQTCNGLNSNNCLTCNDSQLKMLNKNICICKPYYSLQIDGTCSPVCGDMMVMPGEDCDDGNTIQYDGCHQCQFQCQINCQTCLLGKCTLCSSGYYLNQQTKLCLSKCGDTVISGVEQCEDGNLKPFDGCYQCLFQCQNECIDCQKGICQACQSGWKLNQFNQICESYCGDGIASGSEECDDGNLQPFDGCHNCKYSCPNHCSHCSQGHCLHCVNGYQLDKNSNNCISVCGDLYITANEQCDDGNQLQDDGCYQCQFQCQNECIDCQKGICYSCQSGWKLSPLEQICELYFNDGSIQNQMQFSEIHNYMNQCLIYLDSICLQCNNELGWYLNIFGFCETICGDSIVINPYEECDDGNEESFDGCFECRLECEELCTSCIQGMCHECDILGWQINQNHHCQPICNDGLVIGMEECDDMNQIPYDGCFECSFQCEELCTTCIEGVCYECDVLGWQINENHHCQSICNDGLVMGIEECDDQNLIPYDGCFECKFQCHQYCIQCEYGVCLKCDYGYYPYLGQCRSFCGDGFKAKLEECDDDNLNDVDGCSKECKIEENWACITQDYQTSYCFYSKIPQLRLDLFEQKSTEMQIVSLKFNMEMSMISNNVQPQFSFRIIDFEETNYQIQLLPIIPFANEVQFVEYDIYIFFKISVYRPMLIVEVSNITNQYQQTFNLFEGKIYLRDSEVITEGEKEATLRAQSFSQVVIYTMGGTIVLAILTGSLELIWNLLDMLQQLSYIKYINIAFPLNLDTYFEIFKLITISPLVQFLRVDELLSILNGDVAPYLETNNKFKEDQINAYFLSNFLGFLLFFILAYSNYLFSKIFSKLLYKSGPWILSKSNLTFLKIVHKTIKFFRKYVQKFYYSGFIRIFIANYYDVMFAACIQMSNLNWENVNLAINSALSILAIIGQAYLIYNIASKLYSFTKNITTSNKFRYDSIFEGVKEKKTNFWGMQLNSILLIKKFIFMVIIVNCQGNGTIQTIFISIQSTMYLTYLMKTRPFDSTQEFIKQIINELVISFNSLTFLIYKYKQPLQLNYSQVMIMGWIHITLFSVTLFSILLIDIYNSISIIWSKLKLIQQKQKQIQDYQEIKKQKLENEQRPQGQCTMCNQYFNKFNLQLELECKIHKIGVCCQKFTVGCPQCEQEPKPILKIEKSILPGNDYYSNQFKDNVFKRQNSIFQNNTKIFIFKNFKQRKSPCSILNDLQ